MMYQFPIAHIVLAHLPSFDVSHRHQVPTNHLVDDDIVRSTKWAVICQVLAKNHFYKVKHSFHW